MREGEGRELTDIPVLYCDNKSTFAIICTAVCLPCYLCLLLCLSLSYLLSNEVDNFSVFTWPSLQSEDLEQWQVRDVRV